MKLRKKLLITLSIILGIVLVSGVSIYAATSYGTSSDPLVTLSYMNEVKDSVLSDAKKYADDTSSEMKKSFDAAIAAVDSSASGGDTLSDADVFSVVTLTDGQKVTCKVGTEIMLRVGAAKASGGDEPVLIDTATASSVSNGSGLEKNHMYMVTIEGNGIVASGDTVKILIRGDYTIG